MKNKVASAILPLVLSFLTGCCCCVCQTGSTTAGGAAGFHPVELTRYYNKPANSWPPHSSWLAVPWGHQTYDGIPFELGGVLEVTGIDAARHVREIFPGRYTGIPVGATGPWIHLIHGVGWQEKDGVPISRLTLHYQNGQTSSLAVSYGVNARNWWQEPHALNNALTDVNSKVIWSGPNPEQVGRPVTLRIYKTSFPNPHPQWVIDSVDIESLFTHATPVVIALTVGEAGQGVKKQRLETVSLPDRLTRNITVKSAYSGKPVQGARVLIELSDAVSNYPFGQQLTDAAGRTVLDFNRGPISSVSLVVSAPGYMTLRYDNSVLDVPLNLELRLRPR